MTTPKADTNKRHREPAIAILPLLVELRDEVAIACTKYLKGDDITHAVGEVRNALENLEDALDKNREAND